MKNEHFFYEKRYRRDDGETLVYKYSRSFSYNSKTNLESKNEKTYIQLMLLNGGDIIKAEQERRNNVQRSSVSRAKTNIQQLAFANDDLVGLLTLTFAENITDDEQASYYFKLWQKKVRYKYRNFKFLGVKEYQKRGAIHYHLLVNFCPDMISIRKGKFSSESWIYGYSDYSKIKGDDKWRTELYLLKYLGKDKFKPFNQYYVRSRNLKQLDPIYIHNRERIHPLAQNVFLKKVNLLQFGKFDNFAMITYNYNVRRKQ